MGVRRPELVLAAAVLVCLPMVPDIMSGGISTTSALVRFLGAILVCWVLAAIVTSVVDRYADVAAQREHDVQMARVRAQNQPHITTDNSEGGPSIGG